MGDLNSRFGVYAREISARSEIPNAHKYKYPIVPDHVSVPNGNAYVLSAICIDNKMYTTSYANNTTYTP